MNLKTLATLAATIVATTTVVAGEANKSCGANSKCAKKEQMSEAEAEAIEAALMAPPPKDAPPRPKTKRAPPPVMDEATTIRLAVEAEVEAALAGLPSPMSNPEVAEAD